MGPIQKLRVLIIEDDVEFAMVIEEAALSGGYKVSGHVRSGAGAAALGIEADIAIVDIELADKELGTDIGRMLSERYDVSVLFVTGSPDLVSKGFPGALGVLAKPVDAQTLIASLDYVADRRAGNSPVPPPGLIGFA
jgi:DNA-binding response OmpR family regulator